MKYGLDFGTTNSAISFARAEGSRESSTLLPIDQKATDPNVIRTALYFYPRTLVIDPHAPKENIATNEFKVGEIWYEGEFKTEIGTAAVDAYLADNKNRKPGIVRRFYTGKWVKANSSGAEDIPQNVQVPENYIEIDYGTGRLLHALKTGLKSPLYKGTSLFGKFFTLEELIATYVSQIKIEADRVAGEAISEITCGRPVQFSPDTTKDKLAETRLREGLRQAGFKKIDFEFEPVAAAKHYVALHPNERKKIFVFDFGGGTLDTTIVESGAKPKVLAVGGVYIGGNLLNSDILQNKLLGYFGANLTHGERQIKLPDRVFEALKSWYTIPNLNNPADMRLFGEAKYKCSDPEALERLMALITKNLGFELYEAIEVAKKQLSLQNESTIRFTDGIISIDEPITRDEFEKYITPRAAEIKAVVQKTLTDAKTEPEEIDVVIRTGGSSLIPLFVSQLESMFGKEKLTLLDTFTSIASGLSLPRI